MVSRASLSKWHGLAGLLHTLVFVVAAGVALSNLDKINRNGIPVIIWMPIFAGITAIFEIASSFSEEVDSRVSKGTAPLRWIEYSITASIMLYAIAQLSEVTNEYIQAFVIVLPNVLCQYTGYKLETTNSFYWFLLGSVLGIVPWIPISVEFFKRIDEIPSFVIGIYFSLIGLFVPFAVVAYRYYSGRITFARADLEYTFWSFTAKTALVIQVLVGSTRE